MPSYEYRCRDCGAVTEIVAKMDAKPQTVTCSACHSDDTVPIISRLAVHLSSASKMDRLDPKYDKMIDHAMSSNPAANPDSYLRNMTDPAKGTPDD